MMLSIQFVFPNGNTKTSPEFPIEEEHVDKFFDLLGEDNEQADLFFNSDVEQDGELVFVYWFVEESTLDTNKIVNTLSDVMGEKVPDYSLWVEGTLDS